MQGAVRGLRQLSWRKVVPPRSGWLLLAGSPTSAVLFAALVLTIVAKARVLQVLQGVNAWPVALLWSVGLDALAYLGAAALFSLGEGMNKWIRLATYPLALLMGAFALVNAWYLSVAGEQVTWSGLSLGFDRFSDLWAIVVEMTTARPAVTLVTAAAVVGVPLALRFYLARRAALPRRIRAERRAHCAATGAAVGLLVYLLLPAPAALSAARLGANAALHTYWAWVTYEELPADVDTPGFTGYEPPYLVRLDEVRELTQAARPNVLIVVLESTRWDHTSLAGDAALASTPTLAALARGGTVASRTRAVVPHTTKSLFTILCGRLPAMESTIVEYAPSFRVQCLPDILTRAGYDTAFLQSAWGLFEERPRLVQKLGYQQFLGWEDVQGEPLGYLASDDVSLAGAFDDWLSARPAPERPFMATVLTSATHHPYVLPGWVEQRAAELGRPVATDAQRYARLVEAEDQLLASLLETLETRGLRDDTIVIAVGDHGEGFGEKGVRQHDNNFFEEGLRVPLVLAGPGVPVSTVAANATVADVTPTVLGLLGVELAPEAAPHVIGADLLGGDLSQRRLLFSCWFDYACEGFVEGDHKVVHLPQHGRAFYYDLADDPGEARPLPLNESYKEALEELGRRLRGYRTRGGLHQLLGDTRIGAWICGANERCTHPNARALRLP